MLQRVPPGGYRAMQCAVLWSLPCLCAKPDGHCAFPQGPGQKSIVRERLVTPPTVQEKNGEPFCERPAIDPPPLFTVFPPSMLNIAKVPQRFPSLRTLARQIQFLTPTLPNAGAKFTFQTPTGRKPAILTPAPSSSNGSFPPMSPSLRYLGPHDENLQVTLRFDSLLALLWAFGNL